MEAVVGSSASVPPGDLSPKYAKLASEYAKLRAQFGVVKQALVEEQGKSADLGEAARAQAVTIRKFEAEMESVQFRNGQLTKRVHVLQGELEASPRRAKGDVTSAEARTASEGLNSLMGQELQAKIDENAQLHARLGDIDSKYEDVINSLQSRIQELEAGDRKKAQSERSEDAQQKDLIQGLKSEKVELWGQMQSLRRELVDHQDRITVLKVQLESASAASAVGSPVQRASTASVRASNAYRRSPETASFPLRGEDVRIQSVELLSQFGECITDLVASLSDCHTYWEHRLKDTYVDGPMPEVVRGLSQRLLQNVKFLKPVEESFQQGLSQVLSDPDSHRIVGQFQAFATGFQSYVSYVMDLEPAMLSCLQMESNAYSCPISQKQQNSQLQNRWRSYNRVLERISHYLCELQKDNETDVVEAVENLTVAVSQIHQETSELYNVYSAKAVDENNLPTVTDQLKNTNQCIVASLSSLASGQNAISRLLSDNMPRITTLIRVGRQLPEVSPTPEAFPDPAIPDPPPSPPLAVQLELDVLKEENGNLQKSLEDLQTRIRKAEEAKEHWSLEFQLLQLKFDRLRSDNGGQGASDQTDTDKLLGEREADIKRPLLARLETYVSEKLMADSKATSFYLECLALQKRYHAGEVERQRLLADLQRMRDKNVFLQEEVGTTSTNYEGQLSLMSEHVANMNDKLTLQTDEIESLRYELNHKGKKKK